MPELQFLGHAACRITDAASTVLIDPWLDGNPSAPCSAAELSADAVIITHGHNDHVGDSSAIARRCDAVVVAMHEVAHWIGGQGARTHGMSTGGAHSFDWGWVKLTQAWHGACFADQGGALVPLGIAAGVLLRMKGSDSLLYHAGDTGLFGDMAMIGRAGVDVALLPIGDNYTMGPDDALEAVKLIQPKRVAPIHYNTFELLRQDAKEWKRRVEAETGTECVVLEPGETLNY